jgi:nucleoside-diphosphate-sugar epimerase
MPEALIVGCGDIGRRVAALEQAEGRVVWGLVQSVRSAQSLAALGIHPLRVDLDDPSTLKDLRTADTRIYYFAPPPSSGVEDPRMEAFIASLDPAAPPEVVVLISTTGVYGDCAGAWVAEDWPSAPQADRAKRRLHAETTLRACGQARRVPVVILRVPGIYGPGRLPVARLRQGLPVLREEESPYSNRIHAEDLARACLAAAIRGRPDGIYNICDGHPSTMTDYFNRVADALGLPRPPAIGLAEARSRMSAGMLSYLEESRRLDNRRMREELGVLPRYPDLATGLAACIEESAQ